MGTTAPPAATTVFPSAEIIESLPMWTLLGVRHRLYGGFWQTEHVLKRMAAAHKCLKPNPSADSIILATLPKAGTIWLKALAFATLNRATHSPSDSQHPLRHQSPNDCVRSQFVIMLEQEQEQEQDNDATSPRLLQTHMPYSLLPHGVTAEGSRCRIVYVCRNPKDMLVSAWHFNSKLVCARSGHGEDLEFDAAGLTSFEEAFELFCEGKFTWGPPWLHALEYWHESQRRPNEVLFLRYEDMLGDPAGNLKKLAEFMGCAFSDAEEEAGVVDQIVELCSLDSLKSMEVNKNGRTSLMGIRNEAFFRKGQVGDWKNYMTMDMAARLDKIVVEATRGSGLTFADSVSL